MRSCRYFCTLVLLLCLNDATAQNFKLDTAASGLSFNDARDHNGVAVADYDMDGDLDIYMVAYFQYDPEAPHTWNRLFDNEGNGHFRDVTEEAGLLSKINGYNRGGMGNKFGASWADYDNDGDPDLFLTNIGPEILFRNDGNGTFTDVTEQAGLAHDDDSATSSSVWWDYDLDGDLDLYIGIWAGATSASDATKNRFYENLGDGTFIEVSEAAGINDIGLTWTSMPIDVNHDGLPDLYVVNDFGPNTMYLNKGDKTFEDVTAEYGLEDDGNGMGVTVGDYNNDGFFDIYLTNIADFYPNPLFKNTGNNTFVEEAEALGVHDAGWAWGTEFFDCDHDGDLDLYAANGFLIEPGTNHFFVNQLSQESYTIFADQSEQSGANGEAEARGLVVFDHDNDGDLDMLVANWQAAPSLYTNTSNALNWLKINLEGTVSNRNAFGATVRVSTQNGTYYRHNDGVEFLGQSVQPIHVGVQYAEIIDEIVVRWPNGSEETISNVAANQTIKIIEGQGLVVTTNSEKEVPDSFFTLHNPYPNPFNEATNLSFTLPQSGKVSLTVYNLLGQEIVTQDRAYSAGKQTIKLQEQNFKTSGMYIYRLEWNDQVKTGVITKI